MRRRLAAARRSLCRLSPPLPRLASPLSGFWLRPPPAPNAGHEKSIEYNRKQRPTHRFLYSAAVFKVASPDLQQNWSKNFKKHCKILSLSAANGSFNQAYSRAKLSDNKKWRRFYRNFREKISENAVKLRESLSISEIGAAAPQAGAVPRTKRRQAPAAKA